MTVLHRKLFQRTLRKEGEIYALKIIALSIAFACAIVVVLFCRNEFGYDRFHSNPDDVFRVLLKNESFNFEGNRYTDRIPVAVYEQLTKGKNPLLLSRCKVLEQQRVIINNKVVNEVTFQAMDALIDSIFTFTFIKGSSRNFRTSPQRALLSESQAFLFFNSPDCIGKRLKITTDTDTLEFVVAAVFRDFPQNAHTRFDFIIRFDTTMLRNLGVDPADAGLYGRFKVSLGGDVSLLRHVETLINSQVHKADTSVHYQLQPLPEIHFGRRVIGESAWHGDRYSILMLICIASLITFLALTNYVNLTTLTLPNRSGEIAIKKVAGATQMTVLLGLAIESILVVLVAFFLAAVLLLSLNGIIGAMVPVSLTQFLNQDVLVLVVLIPSLLILAITGPLLIAWKFVKAPPGRLLSTDRITFPRFKKVITVLQLGISLSLIVSGIVVQRQITRSLVKEPGRNKDQIVYLAYPRGMTESGLRSLRSGWRTNPNIEDVVAVSHLPDQLLRKELNSPYYSLITETEFPEFFRYPMVSGRWFGPHDTSAVVVNRKGAELHPSFDKPVIGVIENLDGIYNQSEKPVVIQRGSWLAFNFLCVRIIEVDVRETVHYLERYFGLKPGEVRFLDRKFETWLVYEDHLGALCGMLAIVSLAMAGCAIYGLSLSLGNDKIKQVAIHKMLGASFWNIISLLMNSFSMPLLIATFVFGLVTFIGLSEWLRNFTYKAHLTITEALTALVFCVLIIGLTSLRQAQKLAGANLVNWLK